MVLYLNMVYKAAWWCPCGPVTSVCCHSQKTGQPFSHRLICLFLTTSEIQNECLIKPADTVCLKSKLQPHHPITTPLKKYEWHKYIETCIHTSPLSIKLTIHVLDKRKIAALWRAEITAMTAWRLFRSKSFWKTRENFQLLHINLCSIGKNDSKSYSSPIQRMKYQ